MANFSKLNLRGGGSEESPTDESSSEAGDDYEDYSEDEAAGDENFYEELEEAPALKMPFRLKLPPVHSSPPAVEAGADPPTSEAKANPPLQEPKEPISGPPAGLRVRPLNLKKPLEKSLETPVTPTPGTVDPPSLSTAVDMDLSEDSLLDDIFPEDDEEEFTVTNPLLDEDEEVWSGETQTLSKPSLLKSTTGEVMDRDDLPEADFETFEGFGEASVVNPLLDDDEDELSDYVPTSVNPFLEEDEDESLEAENGLSLGDPSSELLAKVNANAEPRRFFPEGLDPEFDKRMVEAPSRKEVVAAEREGKIRKKEAEKAEAKEFKSDFQRKSTDTVNVNELGETRTESSRERKRLAKEKPGGKLGEGELEFYKSLGRRKTKYAEGSKTTELLSGPMNQFATAKEKRERKERLERVFDSRVSYRQGANFRLNEKMTEMLSFLALFRYATHAHLARMFGESPRTTLDRLYRMQANGLVESRKLYAQHSIWFLTEPGIIVSGYDVRKITDSRLTYSMFPHQFTVNHVAANLWGGKLNVLNLQDDFPQRNRENLKGEPIFGERLTSELEILSSFAKMKLFEDSASFRPKLMAMMSSSFKQWADGDRVNVPSPELIYGNEWMFTLFPSLAVGVAYHVPDLVVKRPRAANGAPQSIAVEIEINNKPIGSYKKTLQAYAEDKRIFDKVVWVCKTVGPAKKLEKIGRELGIYQSGKLKIVPIWTNDGVFKGRDLWTI